MKTVCKAVSSGNWPSIVEQRIGKNRLGVPSQPLKNVAAAFVNLQELRHTADYDPLHRFSRADAVVQVDRAKALLNEWSTVAASEERTFFLYLMAVTSSRRED